MGQFVEAAEALADVLAKEEQSVWSDPEPKAGIGPDSRSSLSSTSSIYRPSPSAASDEQQELQAMRKGPLPTSPQTLLSEGPSLKGVSDGRDW